MNVLFKCLTAAHVQFTSTKTAEINSNIQETATQFGWKNMHIYTLEKEMLSQDCNSYRIT